MSILKTRLYKPPLNDKLVVREKLIARLNDELYRPLKLIIAGAGYGKSVLMSQWLDASRQNYCWISLEEDCNDLNTFLSYLIAGIQQIFPKSMLHLSQISSSSQMPSDETIVHTLNNELLDLPESLLIVFDDFHVIRNKSILNLFNEIVKHPPENVQIALLSRLDPPINKNKLQAYQQVSEIRMSDLRLSVEEIRELAKRSVQMEISAETAKAIEKITEGWALSVYLKIRELVEKNTIGVENNLINDRSICLTPFLFNLMESRLPPDAVKVLLVISLFDRSSGGLVEELFKDTDETSLQGEGIKQALLKIKQLESPLLIYLDDDRNWFRLHHLIREILTKRLCQTCTSGQIEKYYRAAGTYFASQDYFEEGIRYAILGKDTDRAVNIILTNWNDLIEYGQNLRLARWVSLIPAGVSNTNPAILVINAYLCDTFYYDYDAMSNYLRRASIHINYNTTDKRLLGAFASVYACFSAQTNDLQNTLKFANLALNTLLPDQAFLQDYALNYKVLATCMIHSPVEAKALIEHFELQSKHSGNRKLMRIHVIKLMFSWNQANLNNLELSGKIVIDIGKEEKVWWLYKMGCYYMGQYYYMKNQISEAYPYIDAGIDCFFNSGPAWTLQLYYSGVLAALADNDLSKANNYLMSAKKFVELNQLQTYEEYLNAFELEFALKTNDIEKAWRINRTAKYDTHPPHKFYYIPQFTQVKLYIQKGDPELMKEASVLIQRFKGIYENLPYARIQISLLEAVWLLRSGLPDKAIIAMSEVIAMTPEDDYIRVFIDMGQPVKELLQALPEEEKQHPLVRNVLNVLRYEPYVQHSASIEAELTLKESEIMDLVAKGLQNKEISEQLYLSESTIKTYLYRIYQKLDVNNRVSALQRIKKIRSA